MSSNISQNLINHTDENKVRFENNKHFILYRKHMFFHGCGYSNNSKENNKF